MKEIGCGVQVLNDPERPFDVRENVLDSTKLATHTGWRPSVSFEQGLLRTRQWLRDCDVL